MNTPTHTPTTPDADPQLQPAMCKCGHVWLMSWAWGFFAEGSEHTRDWCRRIPNPSPANPPGG